MKLIKYNQFLGLNSINENLDKAKKFLKDRYLIMSAVKELDLLKGELGEQIKHGEKKSVTLNDFGEDDRNKIKAKIREISLTPETVRVIESDPELKKLRELKTEVVLPNGSRKTYQLDRDNMGWLSTFTYFFFYEEASFEDLSNIYRKLIENKDIMSNLTIDVNGVLVKKAFDLNFIDTNVTNNMEKLSDGLDRLEQYRKVKKIADKLSINPRLKESYNNISEMNMEKFAEIAEGFDLLTDEQVDGFFGSIQLDTFETQLRTGNPNPLYNTFHFMSTLPRYQNIEEFIKAAKQYLNSVELSKDEVIEGESEEDRRIRGVRRRFLQFCEKVDKCNIKLGNSGAEIVFPENRYDTDLNKAGILIIEVKSFTSNQMLNGHTSHCIKDTIGNWNSYVASHNNKQYYIYDFNVPLTDNNSTIGITIQPGQSVRACHNRPDSSISTNKFKEMLKDFEETYHIEKDLWSMLKPMTNEEIERKERTKIANRKIVEKGLSIEQITKLVKEDGAEINNDSGKCLENAIEENDIKKVEAILKLGALTTLKKKEDGPLLKANGIDMIKLLVEYGAEMNGAIFKRVVNEVEPLQFCLSAGLDPNFGSSLPLRACYQGTWVDSKVNPGESYYEPFLLLMKYIEKTKEWDELVNKGKGNQIIKWAAEYGRIECLEYFKESGIFDSISDSDWDDIFTWIRISRKRTKEDKIKVIEWLEGKTGKKAPFEMSAIR